MVIAASIANGLGGFCQRVLPLCLGTVFPGLVPSCRCHRLEVSIIPRNAQSFETPLLKANDSYGRPMVYVHASRMSPVFCGGNVPFCFRQYCIFWNGIQLENQHQALVMDFDVTREGLSLVCLSAVLTVDVLDDGEPPYKSQALLNPRAS